MMRTESVVFSLFLAIGCGSSTEVTRVSETNTFRFDYNSESYEVVSRRVRADGVQNFLLQKDERRVVLRAVDADRDGWIEAVLLSERDLVDVNSANEIYQAGIREAKNRGLLRHAEIDSIDIAPTVVVIYFATGGTDRGIDRSNDDGLPVAILGDGFFNVESIVQSTLRFNDGAVPNSGMRFSILDVNGDGIADLVWDVPITMMSEVKSEVSLCVSGMIRDGSPFRGCETVHVK